MRKSIRKLRRHMTNRAKMFEQLMNEQQPVMPEYPRYKVLPKPFNPMTMEEMLHLLQRLKYDQSHPVDLLREHAPGFEGEGTECIRRIEQTVAELVLGREPECHKLVRVYDVTELLLRKTQNKRKRGEWLAPKEPTMSEDELTQQYLEKLRIVDNESTNGGSAFCRNSVLYKPESTPKKWNPGPINLQMQKYRRAVKKGKVAPSENKALAEIHRIEWELMRRKVRSVCNEMLATPLPNLERILWQEYNDAPMRNERNLMRSCFDFCGKSIDALEVLEASLDGLAVFPGLIKFEPRATQLDFGQCVSGLVDKGHSLETSILTFATATWAIASADPDDVFKVIRKTRNSKNGRKVNAPLNPFGIAWAAGHPKNCMTTSFRLGPSGGTLCLSR